MITSRIFKKTPLCAAALAILSSAVSAHARFDSPSGVLVPICVNGGTVQLVRLGNVLSPHPEAPPRPDTPANKDACHSACLNKRKKPGTKSVGA